MMHNSDVLKQDKKRKKIPSEAQANALGANAIVARATPHTKHARVGDQSGSPQAALPELPYIPGMDDDDASGPE